ncbi:Leucine-rich repeat-containing protein 59 [Chionoecetes opilio]|uniref:Leucine-rich repeat-containing protein 59 n=1 Tax=Chionoecetes opilio TaxID=41210 RepID=A0A8J5CQ22_CHIOP|nr:Leucine-rich repeat-containing protein 59 [Chionoecetes opilio]
MAKNTLRDKLEGDELDLSMMSIVEIPVKEISALPRATKIDLSSNQLTALPTTFAQNLSNTTHLELGSNKIKEIPSNFFKLRKLKHLDLYNNQLTDLPLSFCQLPSLKWLDLKGNPLNPALRKIAGDCLNQKECEAAARNVIAYLKKLQLQMETEQEEKLQKEKQKAETRARALEAKEAKKRAEKKAAKEKRKAEVRAQLEIQKTKSNGTANTEKQYSAVPKPAKPLLKQKKAATKDGWSLLGWINMLLFLSLLGAGGTGLYIYTDGDLSPAGVSAAWPRIKDNANVLASLTLEALKPENLRQTAQCVGTSIAETASYLWTELQHHTMDLNVYVEPAAEAALVAWLWLREHTILCYTWLINNVDWKSIVQAVKDTLLFFYEQYLVICEELGRNQALMSVLATIQPYYDVVVERLGTLWGFVWEQVVFGVGYVQEQCPGMLESVKGHAAAVKQSIEGLVK